MTKNPDVGPEHAQTARNADKRRKNDDCKAKIARRLDVLRSGFRRVLQSSSGIETFRLFVTSSGFGFYVNTAVSEL